MSEDWVDYLRIRHEKNSAKRLDLILAKAEDICRLKEIAGDKRPHKEIIGEAIDEAVHWLQSGEHLKNG